jgi:hypothetical protein
MVYFSDLEPLPADADKDQLERLWRFRQELLNTGICWQFSSRDQFRRDFARHLAFKLNEFQQTSSPKREETARQTVVGDNNMQVGRDLNVFTSPPTKKTVIARRGGCVTSTKIHALVLRTLVDVVVQKSAAENARSEIANAARSEGVRGPSSEARGFAARSMIRPDSPENAAMANKASRSRQEHPAGRRRSPDSEHSCSGRSLSARPLMTCSRAEQRGRVQLIHERGDKNDYGCFGSVG